MAPDDSSQLGFFVSPSNFKRLAVAGPLSSLANLIARRPDALSWTIHLQSEFITVKMVAMKMLVNPSKKSTPDQDQELCPNDVCISIIEAKDSGEMKNPIQWVKECGYLLFGLVLLVLPVLMFGHVLWFFLRPSNPWKEILWGRSNSSKSETISYDCERLVVFFELLLLAKLTFALYCFWKKRHGCDCKDQCSMDENRGKNETRVDAASRRLKHFKNGKLIIMQMKIIEEIKHEITRDVRSLYESENADAIQNWPCNGNDNIYACTDFNVGKSCSNNFNSGSDFVHLHICKICKNYLGACLPHPAIDCKLLKMMDHLKPNVF